MAKKIFTGFKGKAKARILAVATAAGIIGLTIFGFSGLDTLIDMGRNKPEKPKSEDTTTQLDTGVGGIPCEPDIKTETFEKITSEPTTGGPTQGTEQSTTLGGITLDPGNYSPEPPITNDSSEIVIVPDNNQGSAIPQADFKEVLGKLTALSREYAQNVGSGGNSASASQPELTHTGITSMTIDGSQYVIYGELRNNNKPYNCAVTITNSNDNLSINQLCDQYEISSNDFIDALNELIDTCDDYSLQIKPSLKVESESQVITNILTKRLNDLNSLDNATDPIKREISTITSILNGTIKGKLTITTEPVIRTSSQFIYSATVEIDLGSYIYSTKLVHAYSKEPSPEKRNQAFITALTEGKLEGCTTIKFNESVVDMTIDAINEYANEYVEESTFGK